MSDKPKFPRDVALSVAKEIVDRLAPFTTKIEVAGSLRRGREMVGDVEILYVPLMEQRAADLFTLELFSIVDEELDRMLADGMLAKRPSKSGGFFWGANNKFALHRSGIPVDLFATTEECWFNYLVCRTGPLESNIAICRAAISKGWKWDPYGAGFHRIGHTEPMMSERAVFDFVGLPYNPPEKR